MDREYQQVLADAIGALPASEQVLLRMRFEQDLTLQEIARVEGLKDAAAADRRIRATLSRIRNHMEGPAARPPKGAQVEPV